MEGLSTFTLAMLAVTFAFSATLLVTLIVATVAVRRQHERECAESEIGARQQQPVHQPDSADFKRGT